ncbi:hypothetical protein PRIPAC_86443 [Pristionchus pacificus]|uniref:Uncharacterized protein n=1 Tax=Pristionchus pacificus TaxID=54126 RepID=A0A2A6BMR8_PRIPA|nr:hypothetical protein PRIPAC_86443 [Pristionchus pacificus]|eukprot:PDM67096.1 hypothetical protein PRIPAC_48513 [Pristionchus pacificus]
MSVDVVESVLAAARIQGKKEDGWDEINRRNESLLEDTVAEGNEFQRLITIGDVLRKDLNSNIPYLSLIGLAHIRVDIVGALHRIDLSKTTYDEVFNLHFIHLIPHSFLFDFLLEHLLKRLSSGSS